VQVAINEVNVTSASAVRVLFMPSTFFALHPIVKGRDLPIFRPISIAARRFATSGASLRATVDASSQLTLHSFL
jgi:hypothetical protein